MSSSPNDTTERRRVSKVTISPVSSGNTEALIVRIRKISTEIPEEDIPKLSSTFKPIIDVSSFQSMYSGHSKYTMTDNEKTASNVSQTTEKDKIDSSNKTDSKPDSVPCLKHAAQNISRKASEVPGEKVKLCNDCSKSMLSYIFLVQDFLDSLAQEIRGDKISGCLQCIREEVRNSVASIPSDSVLDKESVQGVQSEYIQKKTEKSKDTSDDRVRPRRTSRSKGHRQEFKKHDEFPQSVSSTSQGNVNQSQKVDFIYNMSPSSTHPEQSKTAPSVIREAEILSNQQSSNIQIQQSSNVQIQTQQHTGSNEEAGRTSVSASEEEAKLKLSAVPISEQKTDLKLAGTTGNVGQSAKVGSSNEQQEQQQQQLQPHANEPVNKPLFRSPMERVQPNYDTVVPVDQQNQQTSHDFPEQQSPSVYREEVDGIVSTLSNVEREIYDTARDRAGWESLTESSSNAVSSEAFVTFCRNNAEAIGCLVLGTSLLLSRTSRNLCVLVSDGVSTAFRDALSSVFHTVQFVRSLDSLGTTKLALLEQPELGITYHKLNIWRLTQYTKCVYLNPDTLVIQNCDELFCHEELSAVPDIGWPDCFNSGVFVFSPSLRTFWELIEFAEKKGSSDGGEQVLLNCFFKPWSSDIHKKLSFIYNLMANVSYTYTPAFRQFGRNVKIVQFHGSSKPWHVKFFTNSGMVSPSSPVHPTYIQFVHIWLKIFRMSVMHLMSQEIRSYAASQEVISAVEILRFFPLPSESEAEFFLTPPSLRLQMAKIKLNRSISLPMSEARRRKSAEFLRHTKTEAEDSTEAASSSEPVATEDLADGSVKRVATEEQSSAERGEKENVGDDGLKSESSAAGEQTNDNLDDSVFERSEPSTEKEVKKEVDENALPGAEIGDYQGMKAWEQGRMDYQGVDSSDNVIKRLQFFMSKPN